MNYLESQLTGKTWVRSNGVHISNPLGGVPTATFTKERVTELSDGTKSSTTAGLTVGDFANPMEQFTLVNPETGDAIGTATLMDVYVLMYSLFMHLENKPIEV